MPGISYKSNNGCDDCNETNNDYQNLLVSNGTLMYPSFNGSSVSDNGFWSKQRDDVNCNQLQKFWCELTPQARQKLLRIDKQTLLEHARKNMYCSRCNGLLLEGFLQIVMYGKSLQQDAAGAHNSEGATNNQNYANLCMANGCKDGVLDPSVHPWGGLTTTRDGTLTLLDCYLYSHSLKGLQNVFDSARARERERKLLYPDACGGGGRGWISQGMAGYSRAHVTRETCALHTARLSVETLVDFWSALGEETRQSLLRMKEEDFIERLMYRFDSKRFCRDCRRNVIREFKELKELKRMRKEPRCTSWFCVADTAFQYEVSCDTVQADWHQTFLDAFGKYHHFEWAIGTEEGKSDIMEFENVGLSGRVQVNGLDLSGFIACYITLRAWKMDGRCNELCVKAHALRGQQCVHCRLVVGDGYLTITIGESIRRFFEHAEETEEEEDDDSMEKDGNELDGECSRPQKHAKSPELAREFLLDAATVIFKEQVEKAFREGTARQNAHSIFVCLALKLLEERVHVACKEIITLEKQTKLLEEEEKEKREEEERKERRRIKDREKKLRRKERLREKENKEKKCAEPIIDPVVPDSSKDAPHSVDEVTDIESNRNSVSETCEGTPASPLSPDIQDDQLSMPDIYPNVENHLDDTADGDIDNTRDWNTSFPYDQFKYSRRKLKFQKDTQQQDFISKWSDRRKCTALSENEVIVSKHESRFHVHGLESSRSVDGFNKQSRTNATKYNTRTGCPKLSKTNNRIGDRYDSYACSCNFQNEYRSRPEPHIVRGVREPKYVNKLESPLDISKPYYRGIRNCNINSGNPSNMKKVWEPLDPQKKYTRSNSASDVALRSPPKVETSDSDQLPQSSSNEVIDISVQANNEDKDVKNLSEGGELCSMARSPHRTVDSPMSSSSNSDNCSSCLSEGDGNTSSTNPQNLESDSEVSSKNSESRETSHREDQSTTRGEDAISQGPKSGGNNSLSSLATETATYNESGRENMCISSQPQGVFPQMHDQSIQYPIFQAPAMGYYHQSPVSWPAVPCNGLMSFPYSSNHHSFANSFGYGLNGNAQYVQYGALQLQHMPPPLLNPVHVPVFSSLVAQANGVVTTKKHLNIANLGVLKNVGHSNIIQKMNSTERHSTETTPTDEGVDGGQNGKSDKTEKVNNGFSLFHFGGPVALSTTGLKAADDACLEERSVGNNDSLNLTDKKSLERCDHHPFDKKDDSIEEYNLFAAASNGIKFSIF